MKRLLLVAVLIVCCASLAGGAHAKGAVFVTFLTPSGNIGCGYLSEPGSPPSLRCDIRSGLVPRPRKPPGCHLAWGDRYEMSVTGRVGITCHGDTEILPNARILPYGTRWSRGGFVCRSRESGLLCENRSGHGFFLSRGHSNRF